MAAILPLLLLLSLSAAALPPIINTHTAAQPQEALRQSKARVRAPLPVPMTHVAAWECVHAE